MTEHSWWQIQEDANLKNTVAQELVQKYKNPIDDLDLAIIL